MSHTNFLYHIVFGTKGRLPLISKAWRADFHAYMGGTVRGLGGKAFEVNGIEDHVHLLASVPPTVRFADFLRDLKSGTSKWANENFGKFGWQRRYGAFTVSESQREVVANYIRRQEEHHRRFDFKSEFETILRANNLEIDPYFWKD